MCESLVRIVSAFIPSREARRRFRKAHLRERPSDYAGLFGDSHPVCGTDRPGPNAFRSGSAADVSVVIPIYNVAPYLWSCLESVRTAARILTESDDKATVEIVAVDDGSTDASGRILDDFSAACNGASAAIRFRAIHQPNAGVSAARNRGMEESRGQILAFLDADDTFAPEALKLIWETARAEGPDLIRYEWKLVRDHSEDVRSAGSDVRIETFVMNVRSSPLHQAKCGAFVVIGRFLAEKLRWPSISHGEDPLFLLDCLHESRKSVAIRASLANYLVRSDSASHAARLTIFLRTMEFPRLAVGKLSSWREWPDIRQDTVEWVCHALFGVCFRAWRDMAKAERPIARAAYWRCLGEMAARTDLLGDRLRRRCLAAVRRQSVSLLALLVVLPRRMRGREGGHA